MSLKEKLNTLIGADGQTLSPTLPENIKNYLIDIDGTITEDVPNEAPEGTEHTVLEKEQRILYHFFKGGSKISQAKREQMFVGLLEGLTAGEAEVLCLAKDKKLGKRWKITKATVTEAFPQIVWGNRS